MMCFRSNNATTFATHGTSAALLIKSAQASSPYTGISIFIYEDNNYEIFIPSDSIKNYKSKTKKIKKIFKDYFWTSGLLMNLNRLFSDTYKT